MPYLTQETIRLLDDVNEGETVEIHYTQEGRQRMAIGPYAGCDKTRGGDWAVFRKNAFVGIPLIDVDSIERVPQTTTGSPL